MQKTSRIIELDGLRGVAALIVIVSHFFGEVPHGTRLLTFGWLGIDVFFVLSGFLIGSIILKQHTQPGFLKEFYLRRVARIVPIYAIVCTVTLSLAALLSGHPWSDEPFSPGVYAAFASNIAMSIQDGGGIWLRPTWTLAVEEQFYLVLPMVICFTPKRALAPLLIALWMLATVFRATLYPYNALASISLLPGRMDLLLGGVLIAYIHLHAEISRYLTALRFIPLIAAIVLVLVGSYSPMDLVEILGPALASIGIACFLLAIVTGAPEGARYRSPTLRWFGQISYALYLIHQPVSGVLHGLLLDSAPDIGTPAQVAVTLLSAAVAIGLAAASWRWLESPILEWARAYRARPVGHVVPERGPLDMRGDIEHEQPEHQAPIGNA